MREDDLHQDLQALVGADLDVKAFVQSVVKFGSFNGDMKTKIPRFFLSVSSLGILTITIRVQGGAGIVKTTTHHGRHSVSTRNHHMLRIMMLVSLEVGKPSITLGMDAVVRLKTLVRVWNPIIVLVSLVLHEVLLLIIINSVLVFMISFNFLLILSGLYRNFLNFLIVMHIDEGSLDARITESYLSRLILNHALLLIVLLIILKLLLILRHTLWRVKLLILKVLSKLFLQV